MPGDSRVERVLDNLNHLAEQPTGWSPDDAHAWRSVALEAKRVIESLDELGPDTAIEQGISRLEMLRLLRGEHPESQVRYRGHHVNVDVNGLDGLVIARLVYTEHDGTAGSAILMGEGGDHARAVRVLREIDITIDAVLAVHPVGGDAQPPLPTPTDPGFTMLLTNGTREVHHFDIENHARSFNEGYDAAMAQHLATDPTIADEWLEQHDVVVRAASIDAALNAAKQVSDATAHLPAENAAVWDVIERIQKLRPVDAPTEQDRAEAEADDERDGKAAARAEEVQTDDE